jgi:uncharacterized protein (DUF1015 family)
VIENRRFRRARAPGVVMGGDSVQELGEHVGCEAVCLCLDRAQAEVDVPEKLSLLGGEEERSSVELRVPACVVQKSRGEEEIFPKPRVQLCGLAAERRDGDRVLEQPARVRVVGIRRCREHAQPRAKLRVARETPHQLAEARMGDLRGEELEETVELLEVATCLGDERGRIVRGRFERANLQLQAVAKAFHAPENADCVPLAEPLVEKIDVAPDASVDPAAWIHQLEGEIRAPAPRAQALFAGHGIGALDDPVLCELRDRHGPILGPASAASLARMPLVKPFRALRYNSDAAGPLDELVSPPYDVISPELERELLARSPYNAVRLVRPHDPVEAARRLDDWRAEGLLVREDEPAVWLSEEEYPGPEGSARVRTGVVVRVALEPYESGIVLPHERSFPKPREGRLRLLRATRAKLSPLLVLHDGPAPLPRPAGPPDLEATLEGVTTRLWRLDPGAADFVRPPLIIADGHHRYEAALRFHEEDGGEETAHVLATLVSTSDPGLAILPTHRVASSAPVELDGTQPLDQALRAFEALPRDRGGFVVVRPEGASLVESGRAALDTALVDELALEGVRYTASAKEAEDAVLSGAAEAAFIVRPPTIEQVEEFARAGKLMPQKSTYFYPKLASGLLFSPFDE